MLKLVVLSALFAVAAARPGLYQSSAVVYSAPVVQEQVIAKVGAVVNGIPTAVSHQSSIVVHNSANVAQPVVAQVVKTVHAPLVQTYAGAVPVLKTIQTYTGAAPAYYTYAAGSPIAYHSTALKYAATW